MIGPKREEGGAVTDWQFEHYRNNTDYLHSETSKDILDLR